MTLEELAKCARCGAEAQIHPYPVQAKHDFEYIVDCVNADCPRAAVTRPTYRTKEEAVAGWNEEQRREALT